jgi:hypothetical protein
MCVCKAGVRANGTTSAPADAPLPRGVRCDSRGFTVVTCRDGPEWSTTTPAASRCCCPSNTMPRCMTLDTRRGRCTAAHTASSIADDCRPPSTWSAASAHRARASADDTRGNTVTFRVNTSKSSAALGQTSNDAPLPPPLAASDMPSTEPRTVVTVRPDTCRLHDSTTQMQHA